MRVYDTDLIMNRVNEFRRKGLQPNQVYLYFDLDNTLALFSPYGTEEESCRLMKNKGFFRGLSCFEEAPAVLYKLVCMGFRVRILSSCVDSPYCMREKRAWVKEYFPFIKREHIILIPVGESKADYIKHIDRAILIDDYYENIVGMYQAGGIGIKKTYSNKERPIPQVNNLYELFGILGKLNIRPAN